MPRVITSLLLSFLPIITSHRLFGYRSSNSRDVVASSPSFSAPPPGCPGELARRLHNVLKSCQYKLEGGLIIYNWGLIREGKGGLIGVSVRKCGSSRGITFCLLQGGIAANVVYQDRVVWRQSYGVKDKKQLSDPPDQDTVFRVASISKIFTVSFFQVLSITCTRNRFTM